MQKTADGALRAAFEAIERAFAARTVEELDAIMAAALKAYGVTHFSMDQIRDASGAFVAEHHFGHWPEDWGAHYIAEQHYRHDKMVRHAIISPTPLRWIEAARERDLTPDEKRLFGEAREFGLRDGFVTPAHLTDGSLAAVSVHSPHALDLSTSEQAAIRLLSLYYCSFGLLLKHRATEDAKPRVALTKRQRECLQWVRAGKSSWEIGEILGISERTVVFHIEEACRRLGVTTRQQAVIEAVIRGLISL